MTPEELADYAVTLHREIRAEHEANIARGLPGCEHCAPRDRIRDEP